jgi:transposase-like protein
MARAYFRGANRKWSLEQKRAAVARMEGTTHGLLAAELGVDKRQLYAWRGPTAAVGPEGEAGGQP